ncbi:MAG TPA: sigma-70 family RNA polymerase sigma factor [Candidatus Paceibacterota bacterium]|nr:sigma-70 family RNA polymerase sigma factor [Candidatus Paceibacterota bacterium]
MNPHTPGNPDLEKLFFELFEAYNDTIFRFVYFQLRSREQALDITQEVFMNTWRYLAQGKQLENPEAFLYRSARNAVIDFYKKKKSLSLDGLMEDGFEPGGDDELNLHLKQGDLNLIAEAVRMLDPKDQQILLLRYTEELPIEEIAEQFGKSTNAMTVQIHRIIQKLKKIYETTYGR